jgi:hypothetical protein
MSGKKPQAAFSQYRFAGDFRFLYKQALNSKFIQKLKEVKLKDTKVVITSSKSKDRQCNGKKGQKNK